MMTAAEFTERLYSDPMLSSDDFTETIKTRDAEIRAEYKDVVEALRRAASDLETTADALEPYIEGDFGQLELSSLDDIAYRLNTALDKLEVTK